jgi:hypothetical protein
MLCKAVFLVAKTVAQQIKSTFFPGIFVSHPWSEKGTAPGFLPIPVAAPSKA